MSSNTPRRIVGRLFLPLGLLLILPGWISPSSAEGFSYALVSAHALAETILQTSDASQALALYKQKSRALAANIIWKNIKEQIMFRPGMRRLVTQSGLLST